MSKRLYYGIKEVPKGFRRATLNEALKNNKVCYYGINKITKISSKKDYEDFIKESEEAIKRQKKEILESQIKDNKEQKEQKELERYQREFKNIKPKEIKQIIENKPIDIDGGIQLSQALKIIKKLPSYLIPVGSIAREQPIVGDIDLLSTESIDKAYNFFNQNFKILLQYSKGALYTQFNILIASDREFSINIWFVKPAELPYMLFSKLYPKNFNIRSRKRAKDYGWILTDRDLIYKSSPYSNLYKKDAIKKGLKLELDKILDEDNKVLANIDKNNKKIMVPSKSPDDYKKLFDILLMTYLSPQEIILPTKEQERLKKMRRK